MLDPREEMVLSEEQHQEADERDGQKQRRSFSKPNDWTGPDSFGDLLRGREDDRSLRHPGEEEEVDVEHAPGAARIVSLEQQDEATEAEHGQNATEGEECAGRRVRAPSIDLTVGCVCAHRASPCKART